MKYLTIILALFIFTQTEAKQKFYKWVDAEGNITYSEKKPPDTQVEELHIVTHDPDPVAEKDDSDASDEEKTPEQLAAEEYNDAENLKLKKAQDKVNCNVAKHNLDVLEKSDRVKRVDPTTGKSIYIDDKERKKKMTEMKNNVKELCK